MFGVYYMMSRTSNGSQRHEVGLSITGLIVAVGVWWASSALLAIPHYLLPPPNAVADQFARNPELYVRNTMITLEKVVFGGTIGITAGFGLGVLLDTSVVVRQAIYPYLVAVRVLPKIVIAPVLLIYLGTGFTTAVIFVALIAFFPLALSTLAGLARLPETHRDLLRSVNTSRLDSFLRVRLPYAMPDLFAGLKQSVTLSVVGAIVAEWVVANDGLGYLILIGSENLQTAIVIAAFAAILVVGLTLYGAINALQRSVTGRFPMG